MGTHLIPREIDGDARILLIFTPKGFLGILVGLIPGILFHQLCTALGATTVAWVLLGICVLIGFVIGQMKMPESGAFDLFRKTGGEYIKTVIINYFKFKRNKKYYVYDADVKKNDVIVDEKK